MKTTIWATIIENVVRKVTNGTNFTHIGGGYMRETGAICQIGVFTWKPCTFWVENGLLFRPFRTTFSMIVAQIVVFIVISPHFNTVKLVISPSTFWLLVKK